MEESIRCQMQARIGTRDTSVSRVTFPNFRTRDKVAEADAIVLVWEMRDKMRESGYGTCHMQDGIHRNRFWHLARGGRGCQLSKWQSSLPKSEEYF